MSEHLSTGNVKFLGRSAREGLTKQRARVLWLYGISGSGKSTLATSVERALHAEGHLTTILDGDLLRTGLNAGLGFSDEDRRENIRRAAEVAALLRNTGVVTICSFITPKKALRQLARQIVGADDFLDIYVKASFETCQKRDVKGLYAKADAGLVKQFTGRDSGFEEPAFADLILETETETPEQSLQRILDFIRPRLVFEKD